jgi:AcrR family transcriptional regulator
MTAPSQNVATETASHRPHRPRDRKQAIVAAAAELFAARGFAAVGIDDIGQRVGITGPAIYRHFKGKDALLEAVLVDAVAGFAVTDEAVDEGITRVVADAVTNALDRPAWMATYIRERQRLPRDRRGALGLGGHDAFMQWHRAITTANPDLSDQATDRRQAAVISALSAVAMRTPTLSRPQLDRLLIDAFVAVLVHPPLGSAALASPAPAWGPPISRRDHILEQALLLFRDRGFRGVGIDEIGEAAGISGPTVYFYFDDKTDILVAAFLRASARVAAGQHEALAGATSARDAIHRLAGSYAEVAAETVDLIVVTSREGHALPASERKRFSRSRREIRDAWVAALREARPDLPDGAARTLVAGVFPLMNQVVQRGGTSTEAAQIAGAFLLGHDVNRR